MAKTTLAQLAKIYGCSVSTLSIYKRDGVDIYDAEAFRAHWDKCSGSRLLASRTEPAPPADDGDPVTYEEARRRKTLAEAQKVEFLVEVQTGKYTANDEIQADMLRIGGAFKAGLLRLENDLPPVLAGLGEAEIQRKIRASLDALLLDFSDATSELYQ